MTQWVWLFETLFGHHSFAWWVEATAWWVWAGWGLALAIWVLAEWLAPLDGKDRDA